MAKAYFAWRDITIAVLKEEGNRLGVSERLLTLATNVVRFSCDGSLVRIIRQFDDTRRSLQQRLHEEQARLAHRALHDQLTGLPNRALLADRLRQAAGSLAAPGHRSRAALPRPRQLQGHQRPVRPSGRDVLLVAVAARLQALARSGDTVARLGGDEFVVLAVDLDDPEAAARSLAERIHLAMREPVAVGERQLHTSVSIGIAAGAARHRPRGVPGPGRCGHVPGQAGRPGPLRGLQPGHRRGQAAEQPAGPRAAGGPRAGPAVGPLPAGVHLRG